MPKNFSLSPAGILLLVLAIALVVLAFQTLLILFAGVVFSVLLRGATDAAVARLHWKRGPAFALVIASFVLGITIAFLLLGPMIAEQVSMLWQTMPDRLAATRRTLEGIGLGGLIPQETENLGKFFGIDGEKVPQYLASIFGAFSTTLGTLIAFLIIVMVGIFISSDPKLYKEGTIRLFAPKYRDRARAVMGDLDTALWQWITGQGLGMLFLGALSTLGLWLVGVPMALGLGLFIGIMTLIPNFGPLIGWAPAVVVTLGTDYRLALVVILLGFICQQLEGNLVTPLIQKEMTSIPPAFLITLQLVLAQVAGVLGLFVATPLAAIIVVLVQKVYIEHYLEGKPILNGPENGRGQEQEPQASGPPPNA